MRVPRLSILSTTLLVALTGLLTACQDGPGARNAGDGEGGAIDPGAHYVAIGDSYTAAPGIAGPSGFGGCGRSQGNYPNLVADELDLSLVDVSCGGATTEAVARPQRRLVDGPMEPPQIDAISETTDLVTIGIGANDNDVFAWVVNNCIYAATKEPDGDPCARTDAGLPADKTLAARLDELGQRLDDVLARVAEAAPDARVVVVGYPSFFGEKSCDQFPIATGDVAYARRVNEGLVEAQRDAADRAGVEYVDVFSATEGHDMCADDPWIAGVHPTGPALAYHPYAKEQEVVAELLVDLLTGV